MQARPLLTALLLAASFAGPLAAKRAAAPARHATQESVRLPAFLQPKPVTQSVLLDLSSGTYGALGVIYDLALGENSLHLGAAGAGAGATNNYWSSVGVEGGYYWWIHKDFWPHPEQALLGWFVGPYARVTQVTWHYDWGSGNATYSGTYFGGGAQGGYQWVFQPGLTARLFADAGFMAGSINGTNGGSVGYGGLGVGAHGAVGWSF